MCSGCAAEITRRRFLGGLGAMAAVAVGAHAAAAECWSPDALAGVVGEQRPHRATAADAFAMPEAASPAASITGRMAGIIRRIEPANGDRSIALTFDLCQTRSPIAGYDGAIVDELRAAQTPATFFAAGRWLETHRERATQLAADPLFELGNHSFDHPDLHGAPAARVAKEILLTESALAATRAVASQCGRVANGPRLFRYPYGSCGDGGKAANAIGSIVIQWDVVSGDPDGTSAATIMRNVMTGVRPGSIVVMHANGRGTHTAEALRRLIPELRGQGYRFVTVSDLLAAGTPVAATTCYINRPGDTARYDARVAHQAPPPAKDRFRPDA